ncbi:MAG TPA: TauD/TfdA family dioxygenase [Roseomonas sp.]|jgi:alpha-ketoglutarate-dependent 2,4-dichlorophenoxyacetate dioxygenase
MAIEIRPVHPDFVAEIGGIDLSSPLVPEDRTAIASAIDAYAVVIFRGQTLDNDTQIAFARNFGDPIPPAQGVRHRGKKRLAQAEISDISNLDADNQLLERNARRRMDSLGNQLWHTDASFRAVPGALSMLYAHVVPPKGGETEFADLRAAYDALPEETRRSIDPLVAEHSIWTSRAWLGFTDYTDEERAQVPPVPQRVVRLHPGSHRRTLYLAAHASHILGWEVPEGRLLLRELMEHATQREFTHRHHWQAGDLVIWDNRCTMHRGRPHDPAEARDLRRVTTRDIASTLDQAVA